MVVFYIDLWLYAGRQLWARCLSESGTDLGYHGFMAKRYQVCPCHLVYSIPGGHKPIGNLRIRKLPDPLSCVQLPSTAEIRPELSKFWRGVGDGRGEGFNSPS
jgi:hypothetical protein